MNKINSTIMSFFVMMLMVSLSGCTTMGDSSDVNTNAQYEDNRGYGEDGYFYPGDGEEEVKKAVSKREPRVRTKKVRSVGGNGNISIAYPTGKVSTSVLHLEKIFPKTVKLGEEYTYTIRVRNLTDLSLQDVGVSETIPSAFNLAKADPNYSSKVGKDVKWDLGTLMPNETRTILVSGKANSKDDLPCCTSADYDVPSLCATTSVIEPAISVEIDVPSSSLVCNRIPVNITVKNTGDSNLSNVSVNSKLPDGATSQGKNSLNFRVGGLSAGETKEYTAFVSADDTGVYTFKANAEDDGVSDESNNEVTMVAQPELTITARSSKSEVYVGRPVNFTINVKNNSNETAESTVVQATIPRNFKLGKVSDNGSTLGSGISWKLGSLAKGESKNLTFSAISTGAGSAETEVAAQATCADPVRAKASANVKGIPALLLEVVDIDDPIEVGEEQTYIINVTNQGSADANNVKIVATLSDMSYVSDSGATKGSSSGRTVTFGTLPRLGAKQVAEWRLTVKGDKAGDLRLKIKMNSDELTSSVEETESTYVY